VILNALAAVLAFIALTHSIFWGSMAYTLIGGTAVGTVPILLVSSWASCVEYQETILSLFAQSSGRRCIRQQAGGQDRSGVERRLAAVNIRTLTPALRIRWTALRGSTQYPTALPVRIMRSADGCLARDTLRGTAQIHKVHCL
jgi:hypothetical protein